MALIALTRMTVADALRQPVTWLMTALAVALIALSFLFGMFNFESQDRMRMMVTAGVAAGIINGLFLAVLGASQAVHDELASRTALTLFAKPLGRGAFLAGKALGVWLVVVASGLVVAGAHLLALWIGWKTGFELDMPDRGFDAEVIVPYGQVLVAHGLGFAHSAVLACLAAVLALRVGLIANVLACFAVFVLGHLLAGTGYLGGGVIPALALFNIDDSLQLVARPVSVGYVVVAGLYSALFCAGSLFLGLAVFKHQDIP